MAPGFVLTIGAIALQNYALFAALLQTSTDIVVRALADDLDGKPYLYLNVGAHPRRSAVSTPGQDRDAAQVPAAIK